MKRGINAYNEINSLNKAILFRPSNEVNNLISSNLFNNSFRDYPDLEKMAKEHDILSNHLRKEGINVIYLIDLIVESLNTNSNIKDKFIKQFIKESGIKINYVYNEVYKLLSSINDNRKLINKCIEGIQYSEIKVPSSQFFKTNNFNDLVIEPLPNMCFLRDSVMSLGNGLIISSRKNSLRHRETIFIEYILKYHPRYKNIKVYNERYDNNLDCSDILVLNNEVICIGLSKDTDSLSVSNLAMKILSEKKFKYIIVVELNEDIKELHLNNLITMIDVDKFVIHNNLLNSSNIYELGLHNNKLVINTLHMSLDKVLEKYLHLNQISFIKCANGNYFDYEKEQYHHATSLLCIKPGVVLSYSINHTTNKLLRENGIKVIELNSSELLKSNSGIHSMIVSLIREK